jgi:predicted esterase
MKNRNPISLVAASAAAFLAIAWLGVAGEVSYLETFDTYPYPWAATNLHASYPDWPNGDLGTALSNGVLRTWAIFRPYSPTNPIGSIRSLVFGGPGGGELRSGQSLELRADVLRLSGDGAYAVLGWQQERLGYFLLKGAEEVALVKYRFDRGVFAPLFWERLTDANKPVTLMLRFDPSETNLALHASLHDTLNNGQELFDRTVLDTPAADPVSAAPPPLQGTDDPGPAWQAGGYIHLSLFGANTNAALFEMDVDNLGLRQTRAVTADDTVAGIYTNAARLKLPYRLFIPTNQQPGTLYPLVLYLHSSGTPGDDNLSQFYEAPLVLLSPESQARHPCFLIAPQLSRALVQQDPTFPWWNIREQGMGLLTNLMARYPIDPDRLYVTGASLGGIGTWSFADTYPDIFAAAVPMAGLLPSEFNGVPSDFVNAITHLPIWVFHGAKDLTIPVNAIYIDPAFPGWATKASRGAVADLRRCGGFPIYTEYAWASHQLGAGPYETPELVDWLMAQRRGAPVQRSPWIAVTAPVSNGVWTTSYTNLDLAGTACADAGITNIVWRNENMTRYPSGPATGTTNWVATGIPLRSGRISGTRVYPFTNLVTVTATGTSWSELYGGTTTFNTVLRVVHVPIRLRATVEGSQTRLGWSGAAPSYVLQRCTDLDLADWADVQMTSETNLVLPYAATREFYRIRLP